MVFSIVDRLNTNYVPTKDEATALEKRLALPEEKLRELDTAISRLQLKLAELNIQRKEVERYRVAIAPARRLLPEILQEVFVHCLPSSHNSAMSSREAPLLLGQVCSQWRQIAHATPRLWTSIHIVIRRKHVRSRFDRAPSLQDISSWLSRSGALPLTISVSSPGDIITLKHNPEVEPYLALLSPLSARWKSLYLSIPNFNWWRFLEQYNADDVPLLERVHIESYTLIEDESDGSGTTASLEHAALTMDNGVLQAPRLRSLSMPFRLPGLWKLPIRWDGLTALRLLGTPYSDRRLEFDDVAMTLMSCPNLEICSISFGPPAQPHPSHPATNIHLPKLRSLSISDDSMISQPSSDLLKRLHVPTLRHLRYEAQLFQPPAALPLERDHFLDAFPVFLNRLTFPLEELELMTVLASSMDVIGILSMLPGLKRLSLRSVSAELERLSPLAPWHVAAWPPFLDHHLKRLTPQSSHRDGEQGSVSGTGSPMSHFDSPSETAGGTASPTSLCPKLEVFYCTGAMFSDSVVLDFLHSRSGNPKATGVARLRMVKIELRGKGLDGRTRRKIQALGVATGMSVDVTCSSITPMDLPTSKYSPYDGLERI